MKTNLVRTVIGIVTLGMAAIWSASYPLVRPACAQVGQSGPVFGPAELDQLLAPIALYSDDLLAKVLMAATYPLEVIEAHRWVRDRYNVTLRGDQLAAALADKDWDPSVKSLVPFPQILQMMDDRLDWMQKLGDAFLARQADVMDSVQRLRARARAAGRLQSTPEQIVTLEGPTIIIRPAIPQVIYVPVYDPIIVYGGWPYPAYPPFYFPPPVPFFGPALVAGISFGIGIVIVDWLWGWCDWDWGHHRIHIDRDRFNFIHRHRPPFTGDWWEHDPYHRRGVFYRDRDTRQRYQPGAIGSPDARRGYRGYDQGDRLPGQRPGAPEMRREIPGRDGSTRPGQLPSPRPGERAGPQERRPGTRDRQIEVPRPQGAVPGQLPSVGRSPARTQPSVPRPPSAFQGIERGADVRAHEERGRSSRETFTPPAPRRDGGNPPGGREQRRR